MSKKKCLQIGVGGMARAWIFDFWVPQHERMEFAGFVDINPEILRQTTDSLGLSPSLGFTNLEAAFEKTGADFCCIVTPPQFHRAAVELACQHGMDILSEKPIAASWDDCVAIYKAVEATKVKMLVTQNYRYSSRILTLKSALADLGPVNYAIGRYASDYRVPGSWGANFRHSMPHSLLVEGGIHHFDQLRNLAGGSGAAADVETIAGFEWHPGFVRGEQNAFAGGESFQGEPNGLYVLSFNNGAFGSYEGNNLATGKTNGWHSEAYRVECEGGVATLDRDNVVRVESRQAGQLVTREVAAIRPKFEGHRAMPEQFLNWLEGGETPPTVLQDNIKSNATLFAAIEAAAEKKTVNVREFLEQSLAQ